ncbi:MAG: hypothetical protein E4G99_10655 [Anaerolineales bacterium]|nr:MAG: hypothetical protein E4G99_10655 [Anaerolineales bacterium]
MSEPPVSRPRMLTRPSLTTRFHIDYNWWERAERDLDVYLRSHLCPEHQELYSDMEADVMVDTIHPETAEVTRVLGIQHTLITHCALEDDYLTPQTTLVNAVFRIFLANGNTPLSPEELGEMLSRSGPMILRTLSSSRVYKGIRPYFED